MYEELDLVIEIWQPYIWREYYNVSIFLHLGASVHITSRAGFDMRCSLILYLCPREMSCWTRTWSRMYEYCGFSSLVNSISLKYIWIDSQLRILTVTLRSENIVFFTLYSFEIFKMSALVVP